LIENLHELVGGHQVIQAATERFYRKILEDENLHHFFGQTDMAHLRSRQVMFITMLLGGGVYTGKDIRVAHAEARVHGLKDEHFDLFLKHFRSALEEEGVKPENATKITNLLERRRRTVVDA
jgi:hemoglobin